MRMFRTGTSWWRSTHLFTAPGGWSTAPAAWWRRCWTLTWPLTTTMSSPSLGVSWTTSTSRCWARLCRSCWLWVSTTHVLTFLGFFLPTFRGGRRCPDLLLSASPTVSSSTALWPRLFLLCHQSLPGRRGQLWVIFPFSFEKKKKKNTERCSSSSILTWLAITLSLCHNVKSACVSRAMTLGLNPCWDLLLLWFSCCSRFCVEVWRERKDATPE